MQQKNISFIMMDGCECETGTEIIKNCENWELHQNSYLNFTYVMIFVEICMMFCWSLFQLLERIT